MFKTGDGKKFKTVQEASEHAKAVFLKSGTFIAIEEVKPKKYNVIAYNQGSFCGVVSHRDKTEFSLRTAKKYAEEHAQRHGRDCTVIDADEPIHTAKPVFIAKAKG